MEVAIDAGADDVVTDDEGGIEVNCAPTEYQALRDAFEKAGFKPEVAELTMKPTTEAEFSGEEAEKCRTCSMRSKAWMTSRMSTPTPSSILANS